MTVQSEEIGVSQAFAKPQLMVFPIDMPPLRYSHALVPGVYIAACPRDRGVSWPAVGAFVFESLDGWQTLRQAARLRSPDVMGAARWESPDRLRVDLFGDGELYSAKPAQLDAGVNRALVGAEVVAYETAKQAAQPGSYVLSGFRRGLRGTARAPEGQWFSFLGLTDFQGVWIEFDIDTETLPRQYKVGLPGDDLADLEAVTVPGRGD